MSDQTQGAKGERVAEVEGACHFLPFKNQVLILLSLYAEIIKFPDLHVLSDDKLLMLMYGISHNSLSLDPPWDSNIALKWPLELLLSSQHKPTNNTVLPPKATKPPDSWCYP